MTKNIPCRNKDCFNNNDSNIGCGHYHLPDLKAACPVYNRLLPLWEYQDRFKNKTKAGKTVHILKVFLYGDKKNHYACGYVCDECGIQEVVFWNKDGRGSSNNSLIPKENWWYAALTPVGELGMCWNKDDEQPPIPLGWNIVKLKQDNQ